VSRRLQALVALLCTAGALVLWATPQRSAAAGPPPAGVVAQGRTLFAEGCSYCHGTDARGVPGRGPNLRGVGAAAADFMLSTGRMPLAGPGDEPTRNRPAYDPVQQRALVAYVGSFGGPPIPPPVDPAAGSLQQGRSLFTEQCAGCHTVTARGGVVPGAVAPALQQATPTQIAEAVRTGPQLMPIYGARQLDQRQLDGVARYVLSTRHLDNPGGWAIGNLGPVPEGLVAWLLAGTALLIAIRLLGERTES
jgi:ubiquinol-cytochrome c reductase cytochrome c subunit